MSIYGGIIRILIVVWAIIKKLNLYKSRGKRQQIAEKLFTKRPRRGLDDIVLGDHIRMRS